MTYTYTLHKLFRLYRTKAIRAHMTITVTIIPKMAPMDNPLVVCSLLLINGSVTSSYVESQYAYFIYSSNWHCVCTSQSALDLAESTIPPSIHPQRQLWLPKSLARRRLSLLARFFPLFLHPVTASAYVKSCKICSAYMTSITLPIKNNKRDLSDDVRHSNVHVIQK